MLNSASTTYQMKREILTFSSKISKHLSKPERKFAADMSYGMLASGSCLLTDIVDRLHEDSQKVNSVERLTRNLNKGTPAKALSSYLSVIRRWIPDEPVIHIPRKVPRSLSFQHKSTDDRVQKRYLSGSRLWHYRASHDAGNQ